MLEIIVLIAIARGIGGIVERKGRTKIGYQLMAVALWIGGEVLGFIVGVIVVNATDGADVAFFLLYGCALGGAILGAVIAFSIVSSLPPIQKDDDFYRGGAYDRPLRDDVYGDAGRKFRGEGAALPPRGDSGGTEDDRLQR